MLLLPIYFIWMSAACYLKFFFFFFVYTVQVFIYWPLFIKGELSKSLLVMVRCKHRSTHIFPCSWNKKAGTHIDSCDVGHRQCSGFLNDMNILSWACIGLEHDIMHLTDIKSHINKWMWLSLNIHGWGMKQCLLNNYTCVWWMFIN